MKIFYHPVHCSLEYDEMKILTGLGHSVFSTGIYIDPDKVKETIGRVEARFAHDRPSIEGLERDEEKIRVFQALNPNYKTYSVPKLSSELLSGFDIIYISHDFTVLQYILNLNPKAQIVYNTVSQIHPTYETFFQQYRSRFKLMRFSHGERSIVNYAGEDVIIHPGVDREEFFGWNGTVNKTLMVSRAMPSRPMHTNLDLCSNLIRNGLPIDLYGTGNEELFYSKGALPFEKLRETYANYRVFLNLNTKPAPLTYTFIEALMTGCPMVSVGPVLGSLNDPDYGKTFIGHTYLDNGVSGLWSDNPGEIIQFGNLLLDNEKLAKSFSEKSREIAIKHFDRSIAISKWRDFLNTLG